MKKISENRASSIQGSRGQAVDTVGGAHCKDRNLGEHEGSNPSPVPCDDPLCLYLQTPVEEMDKETVMDTVWRLWMRMVTDKKFWDKLIKRYGEVLDE